MTGRGTISDVFNMYDKALSQTRNRLENRVVEGTEELKKFYAEFMKDHIIKYNPLFGNEAFRREIHRDLQQRIRSNTLRFWAIDGACRKIDTSDLAIFYGGAYLIKGELELQDNPPKLKYRQSEPEDDSSIVAYLPLSPEDLTMLNPEDRFVVNDSELVSTSGLDTSLMLLAEIFLCYRGASGTDRPHLILWDHSLSSVLANATPNVKKLSFSGLKLADEIIWYPDLLVGYSKPWNEELDVPSKKAHALWQRAIAKLYEDPNHTLNITTFASETRIPKDVVVGQIQLLWKYDKYGMERTNPEHPLVYKDGDILKLNDRYLHSPEKIRRLYEYFCNKFFKEKDPSVLLYKYEDEDGLEKTRFLSTDEISFLMALGLRLTFEEAWKNDVMLVGVVKDSASTYFTNHYFGVMRHADVFHFTPRKIPATDRLTLERLPYIDETIEGVWGSTEFDSIFMTLRMKKDLGSDIATLQGVRGNVLMPPNLIMRSLVQFYLRRDSSVEPLMGHVIFVDRLISPSRKPPEKITITEGDRNLGTITPFFHKNKDTINREQEITIYLLSVLTRNVFPEVVGYPDPLHHADRGAKSVLKMVEPMLLSSERLNRLNPINRTLRQNRGG